jgi:hypothetical protein
MRSKQKGALALAAAATLTTDIPAAARGMVSTITDFDGDWACGDRVC